MREDLSSVHLEQGMKEGEYPEKPSLVFLIE